MSNTNLPAVATFPKASDQLALSLGIEKGMMIETLKAQCFKGKRPEEVTDAQLASFISVTNNLGLNPLLPGMVYAYPERNGGITPIIGPDGTFKKLDEMVSEGKLEGFDCTVFPEDVTQKPTHATATIYRKNGKPATYTALFSEWVVGSNPNWAAKPRHMIWLRAIKQAARQVIHGLPMDTDEYELSGLKNVTPDEPPVQPDRPKPPPRKAKGAAAIQEAEVVVDKSQGGDVQMEPPPGFTPQPPVPSNPAPAAQDQKVEPTPAPAPSAPDEIPGDPPAPLTVLEDGQKVEGQFTIKSAKVMGQAPNQYAAIEVDGPFRGWVYDRKGVKDGAPVYTGGGVVKLRLAGQKQTSGKVMAFVEAVL